MATSTCGKCEGTTFEIVPARLKKANYQYYFVQCASCGTVVSATEGYYVPTLLAEIAKKLGIEKLL